MIRKISISLVGLIPCVCDCALGAAIDFSAPLVCKVSAVGTGNYLLTDFGGGVAIGDLATTQEDVLTLSDIIHDAGIKFMSPSGEMRLGSVWMYASIEATRCEPDILSYISPDAVGGPFAISIKEHETTAGIEVLYQKSEVGKNCPSRVIDRNLLVQLSCESVIP